MWKFYSTVILVFISFFFVRYELKEIERKKNSEEAYEYFKNKCESQAGEFIYRTVENVEGLYQMRLRDPRDYFDRMRYGDIPEDPYGHTNVEAQKPWVLFVKNPSGRYQFLETKKAPTMRGYKLNIDYLKFAKRPVFTGQKFWRYELIDEPYTNSGSPMYRQAIQVDDLKSKYGFTWKEVRDEKDKEVGVWGGEISVVDLKNKEVIAIKRGFVLINKYGGRSGICPKDKDDFFIYKFISKVLKPKNTRNRMKK